MTKRITKIYPVQARPEKSYKTLRPYRSRRAKAPVAQGSVARSRQIRPKYRPSPLRRFLTFLSSPAWQGVGAFICLVSLVATVVLTLLVFYWTKEQTVANFVYDYHNMRDENQKETKKIFFVNTGPAVAREWGLDIVMHSIEDVDTPNRCFLSPESTDSLDKREIDRSGKVVPLNALDQVVIRYDFSKTDVAESVAIDCSNVRDLNTIEFKITGLNVIERLYKTGRSE